MKKILFSSKIYATDFSLLLLRVTFGLLLLINHGITKIPKTQVDPVKFMNFMGMGPTATLWLTIFAEVGCSLLIVIGLATRLAAIPLIITMLVAIFVANAGAPFEDLELGILYLVPFLILLITGPGKYAVDRLL